MHGAPLSPRKHSRSGSGGAARDLYLRFGFKPCGPFGEYKEDPYSAFMTRKL